VHLDKGGGRRWPWLWHQVLQQGLIKVVVVEALPEGEARDDDIAVVLGSRSVKTTGGARCYPVRAAQRGRRGGPGGTTRLASSRQRWTAQRSGEQRRQSEGGGGD
jgi:hypothetical protein